MSSTPYYMFINDMQCEALVDNSLEFQSDRKALKELIFSVYTDDSANSDVNKILTTYSYSFNIRTGNTPQSPIIFYGKMSLDKVKYFETATYSAVQFIFLEKQ